METIYSRLRQWRRQRAKELNLPDYFILSNAHLAALAVICPTTAEQLAACPGLGPKKLTQFSEELLALVSQCLAEGLEPGVAPPVATQQPAEPLSEADLAEIASGLRKEMAQRLARRFKGRFSAAQVEEALLRLVVAV